MTVTSKPLADDIEDQGWAFPELPVSQFVAVVFWLIGMVLTYRVIAEFGEHWIITAAIALTIQAGCTKLESPIWRRWGINPDGSGYKRPLSWVNFAALAIDTAANIGGVWFIVKRLHTVSSVRAIGEMFGVDQIAPLTGGWALLVCAIIGLVLAAVPEKAWFSAGE